MFSWLHSWHTFSFGRYYDPLFMGFRSLRVINDDRIQPGGGFPTHGHANMEIITWVLDGALAHRDSTGGQGQLENGIAQVMSAGRGIEHSEFNGSDKTQVHLLQIWIEPSRQGVEPRYADRNFPAEGRMNRWQAIASGDGRDDSLKIEQDAAVYVTQLAAGNTLEYDLADGRGAWMQIARGAVKLNGQILETGDGASIEQEPKLAVTADADSELLLFDLA